MSGQLHAPAALPPVVQPVTCHYTDRAIPTYTEDSFFMVFRMELQYFLPLCELQKLATTV
jgi:hypothetical protein